MSAIHDDIDGVTPLPLDPSSVGASASALPTNSKVNSKGHKKSRRNRKKKGASKEGGTIEDNLNQVHHREELTVSSKLSKIAETVEKLGYSKDDISAALNRLKEEHEDVTFGSLIDMSCLIQQETLEKQIANQFNSGRGTEQTTCNSPDVDGTNEDSDSGEDADHQITKSIENRKMELRAAIESLTFQCKVCRCSRATILLLPCGHLASCDDCLMDVRRCPIARCNKVVRGTKEVYFA